VFKSGSTRLVKGMNQQHVLNLVRMHRGITAPELSRATGLQMSTISYTLRELKARGTDSRNRPGRIHLSRWQAARPLGPRTVLRRRRGP